MYSKHKLIATIFCFVKKKDEQNLEKLYFPTVGKKFCFEHSSLKSIILNSFLLYLLQWKVMKIKYQGN